MAAGNDDASKSGELPTPTRDLGSPQLLAQRCVRRPMANSICATEAPKAPAAEQMANGNGNGVVTKPEQNGDEEQHVDSMLVTQR
jgi:hypothetical protein